jgi:hypothetical protein
VDESRRGLHAAGWSIGDAGFDTASGSMLWQVCGNRGQHELRAEGHSQGEAWHRACALAEAAGLLLPLEGTCRG